MLEKQDGCAYLGWGGRGLEDQGPRAEERRPVGGLQGAGTSLVAVDMAKHWRDSDLILK